MRPYIEAVTVCVDYADYLAEVIPFNRPHLARWIIVTTPYDRPTLDLCHKHNLEVLTTMDFYSDGDEFNKGRGIERGLAMLGHKDWVLHLDGDIALPGDFLDSLEDADLDEGYIYGVDRLRVQVGPEWDVLKTKLRRGYHVYVDTHGLPLGGRWADIRHGYVPIGFFQLWHESADHRKGVRLRRYPDCHSDAARADVKFALQWDRARRALIPEVLVAHLEHGNPAMGANWKGRTTPLISPAMAPVAY